MNINGNGKIILLPCLLFFCSPPPSSSAPPGNNHNMGLTGLDIINPNLLLLSFLLRLLSFLLVPHAQAEHCRSSAPVIIKLKLEPTFFSFAFMLSVSP